MHSLVLQERCNQTCFSPAFRSSWGLVTPRTPDKTPLLPAESHRRCPIPLHTASKVWLCLHFINHTILSVTLLHTFLSMHTPLASSKPISRSAHALLTPSLHLKRGLPLPLCPSTSDILSFTDIKWMKANLSENYEIFFVSDSCRFMENNWMSLDL